MSITIQVPATLTDMSDLNIDLQEVINDLAEQVKRLTVDNAVLRAALRKAAQTAQADSNQQS